MKKPVIAIVIPTIRNLDFLNEWEDTFNNCIGIITEDSPKKTITTPSPFFKDTYHYSWKEIDKELGKDSWIIPRKNSGIRNYGFYKAWQLKADIIITLDDDCYPTDKDSFVEQHVSNLSMHAPSCWFPTYPHRKYCFTRGFPYDIRKAREVVVSHGLWSNILDFDAPTHLQHLDLSIPEHFDFIEFIPKGNYYPMCSMNLAFQTKVTPLLYFPPMGSDNKGKPWGFDRFDDIWAGIFSKKIIDHLQMAVINGAPFVEHRKASNVFQNLKKEAAGIEVNETLYKEVDKVVLTSKTITGCYKELAKKTQFPDTEYFTKLRKAMIIWAGLFE